jgi:hypothetical protein
MHPRLHCRNHLVSIRRSPPRAVRRRVRDPSVGNPSPGRRPQPIWRRRGVGVEVAEARRPWLARWIGRGLPGELPHSTSWGRPLGDRHPSPRRCFALGLPRQLRRPRVPHRQAQGPSATIASSPRRWNHQPQGHGRRRSRIPIRPPLTWQPCRRSRSQLLRGLGRSPRVHCDRAGGRPWVLAEPRSMKRPLGRPHSTDQLSPHRCRSCRYPRHRCVKHRPNQHRAQRPRPSHHCPKHCHPCQRHPRRRSNHRHPIRGYLGDQRRPNQHDARPHPDPHHPDPHHPDPHHPTDCCPNPRHPNCRRLTHRRPDHRRPAPHRLTRCHPNPRRPNHQHPNHQHPNERRSNRRRRPSHHQPTRRRPNHRHRHRRWGWSGFLGPHRRLPGLAPLARAPDWSPRSPPIRREGRPGRLWRGEIPVPNARTAGAQGARLRWSCLRTNRHRASVRLGLTERTPDLPIPRELGANRSRGLDPRTPFPPRSTPGLGSPAGSGLHWCEAQPSRGWAMPRYLEKVERPGCPHPVTAAACPSPNRRAGQVAGRPAAPRSAAPTGSRRTGKEPDRSRTIPLRSRHRRERPATQRLLLHPRQAPPVSRQTSCQLRSARPRNSQARAMPRSEADQAAIHRSGADRWGTDRHANRSRPRPPPGGWDQLPPIRYWVGPVLQVLGRATGKDRDPGRVPCPCATGRHPVGRSPRLGRVEIRLGPAWVRYRESATPETDPPSTFHRPVLIPGRHRARSSRLRVTLPRCRPCPWCPPAAMPTSPNYPAGVRSLQPDPRSCCAAAGLTRRGAC